MANSSPIADLSYRGYEGQLEPPSHRWQVIAKQILKQAFRKRSYWVVTALSGWYYLIMLVIVFFIEQVMKMPQMASGDKNPLLQNISWSGHIVHGFSYGTMFWLWLALMLGSGAIANDNRANALLVYLSKPCTKRDYVIGKWVGVWAAMFISMTIPSLFFYAYGLLNFRDYGFPTDPLIFVRMIGIMVFSSAFHTSVMLGISSLFNQGRMAGVTYAAIFFVLLFFTKLMSVAWMLTQEGQNKIPFSPAFVQHLTYCSPSMFVIGIAKYLMGTDGTMPFLIQVQGRQPMIPRPELWFLISVFVFLAGGAIALVWNRVRAVEVVK
jgi:ABC-2 type transport system permease protein